MRYLLALLTAIAFVSPAFAGTKAVYSGSRRPLEIEVADNGDLRVGFKDFEEIYNLLIGNVSYLVFKEPKGGWRVMRLADLSTASDRLSKRVKPTRPPTRWKFDRQRDVEVNGRTGTLYKVRGIEMYPSDEYVMSHDPALAPIGRGVRLFVETSAAIMNHALVPGSIAETRRLFALGTLLHGGMAGDIYKLDSVETVAVNPARLALPAKPMTVDEIVAEMKAEQANR